MGRAEIFGASRDVEEALVDKKRISVGMSRYALIASWGLPEDVNKTVTQSGVHEQFLYGEFPNSSYEYVDNGVATSYQQ